MKRMRKIGGGGVALLLALVIACVSAPVQAAPAEVTAALNQASADPAVVIVVPNMSALSNKVALINDALNLGVPAMGDALGQFKQSTGMTQGLRDNGPMLIVIPRLPQQDQPEQEPPAVVLMPVADYAAFVRGMGGDPEEALSQVTLPMGQDVFVRKLGDFAALSSQRPLVEGYKPANAAAALTSAAGRLGARYLGGSDAAVFINVSAMAERLRPMLKEGMGVAQEQLEAEGDMNGQGPMLNAIVKLYGQAADAVLRDTSTVVLALDIAELGVGMTGTAQFKPDSKLAKMFPDGAAAAPMLNRAPRQPYLLASVVNLEKLPAQMIMNEIIANLPENDPMGLGKILRASLPLVQQTLATAQVYYPPPGAGGMASGIMNSVAISRVRDSNAYVQAMRNYLTSLNEMKAPVVEGDGAGAGMSFTTQYTPKAMEIEGVPVDQFQVQYNIPPELMQEMGPMMMMMGATGQTGYIAPVADYVVMTGMPNPQLVRDAIVSTREGNGLGQDPLFNQIRQQLPANASAEAFVSIPGIFKAINDFAAGMGMPLDLQAPDNLPPAAWGMGIEQGGVASRAFIPMAVMRVVREQIEQAQAQMQPQPQPGQGGTAPPAPF